MNNLVAFPKPSPPQPPDATDRTAALDIESSCIVEAPAGSGKTGLLVQRFIKLLAHDAVAQPEEILAITFTRKATAEMQQRILDQLHAAHTETPIADSDAFARHTRALATAALARSSRLGWNLLTQPHRLNIRSIESVNMDLAGSRPLLADSAGPLAPVDDAQPLYHLAARRTLLQLGGPDPALHHALEDLLLHRDGSVADCENLIANMLQTREQWGELVPLAGGEHTDATLDHTVRPRLEQTLATIVCSGLQRALDAVPPHVLQHLTHFAQRHAALPGYNGAPSPIASCAGKHQPPSAIADHLDHWRALIGLVLKPSDRQWRASLAISTFGFKPPKAELDDFKLFLTSIQTDELQAALAAVLALPEPCYTNEQWAIARSLFLVLRHALVELKLLFAARGECDFSEFALTARQALGTGGDITDFAIAAGGKLRHLLVDEMQDTSTGQYELIRLLTQSWDGNSQTLFLVGDPKQSIYLFRQARVERFLRTMQQAQLGDLSLKPLHLTANFRSQAKLVEAFNHTFGGTPTTGRIFPPPNDASLHGTDAVDVPFVAAVSTREETQPLGIQWHTAVLGDGAFAPEGTASPSQARAAHEALAIRRIIQQRLQQPLPAGRSKPWSIAVLARVRKHLDAVVTELKAHHIDFRGVDLDALNERPEVLDAIALLRALLHPADRPAWLAVLHAPWCGLGLADLLTLAGADPQATVAELVAARRTSLSPTGQQLLARAWPILATAVDTLGRTSLSVHVERTWRSLGGDLALQPDQQANVQRLLSVLREVESDRNQRNPLAELTARINNLYAEPRTGDIQVDLMTIHKAKGLEWDVVLIPGLQRKPRDSDSVLLNWLELDGISSDADASIVLAPIWGKGADSDKLNQWLKEIRTRRDRAEEKRLFYVACTRAREELHLFAALKSTTSGALAQPVSGSLLKACWPAAEPQFAALSARPQEVSSRPEAAHFAAGVERPAGGPADADDGFTLALAAAADSHPPTLQRLPLTFDPAARFAAAALHRLDYTPAAALPQRAAFDRPEGGFAARAFGNVVHRYLQVLAARLADGTPPAALLNEISSWTPRLLAGLRGEGIPPRLAATEAARALRALTLTLSDPTGLWILSPHTAAASERALNTAAAGLRVDRTFLAGDAPLSGGEDCIWIVDFKTTEPGSRSAEDFAAAERARYTAQLEAYAKLRRTLPGGHLPIHLGLFYPLIPRLLHWPSLGTSAPSTT